MAALAEIVATLSPPPCPITTGGESSAVAAYLLAVRREQVGTFPTTEPFAWRLVQRVAERATPPPRSRQDMAGTDPGSAMRGDMPGLADTQRALRRWLSGYVKQVVRR